MKRVITVLLSMVFLFSMMTVSVAAAPFTPSVESKPAPGVVPVKYNNQNVSAIIIDSDGNEVAGVPYYQTSTGGGLLVTPHASVNDLPDSLSDREKNELMELMQEAYDQINDAGTLDELQLKSGDKLLTAEDKANGIKIENLVVIDLIDVSLFGNDYQLGDGKSVTVRFQLNLDPNAFLKVLHYNENGEWDVIPDDRIQRYDDGSVEVTFTSLSPVAFVVDKTEVGITDPDGPKSPQTGEGLSVELFGALLLGIAATFCFTAARRKNNEN